MKTLCIALLLILHPALSRACELALVIALDVSRSVDKYEYRLMRNGIGHAFLDDEVIDLIGWMLTIGRRPLKRSIPNQQLVLEVKHLRSARGRLSSAHVSAGERQRLAELFAQAEEHLEEALRERLRGSLVGALDAVGLKPAHIPEEVARTLIAEPSRLRPRTGHGTALVLDIAGFTQFAAGRAPGRRP